MKTPLQEFIDELKLEIYTEQLKKHLEKEKRQIMEIYIDGIMSVHSDRDKFKSDAEYYYSFKFKNK